MNLEYFYDGAEAMTKTKRTKHEVILQDHIFHLHKDFRKDETLRNYATKNPRMFDIEHLNEESFNHATGYKKGKEDTDTIDAYKGDRVIEYKTGSIRLNPKSKSKTCHDVEIRNIVSQAGVIKQAPIVVTMYNAPCDRVDYLYIPQEHITKLLSSNGKKGNKKIKGTFNTGKNTYGEKLDKYRVSRSEVIRIMK